MGVLLYVSRQIEEDGEPYSQLVCFMPLRPLAKLGRHSCAVTALKGIWAEGRTLYNAWDNKVSELG